ncbi:MAG: hypothetical protein ACI9PZ_002601 [Parvicella sp.]|jgi:hypothetical protein
MTVLKKLKGLGWRSIAVAGLFMTINQVAISGTTVIKSGVNKASVVELYTSEGCSSCPPADDYLRVIESKLGEGAEVFPLAFHVDYWNYLGWNDPFSKSEYTKRQRRLGAINEQRTIYTPEFIVDGLESRNQAITQNVINTNASKAKADIELELDLSQFDQPLQASIKVDNIDKWSGSVLYVALYESDLARNIESGENRGKILHHDYVVRDLIGPKRIKNGDTLSFDLPLMDDWQRENMGLVVMVKSRLTGETLQAIRTPLVL